MRCTLAKLLAPSETPPPWIPSICRSPLPFSLGCYDGEGSRRSVDGGWWGNGPRFIPREVHRSREGSSAGRGPCSGRCGCAHLSPRILAAGCGSVRGVEAGPDRWGLLVSRHEGNGFCCAVWPVGPTWPTVHGRAARASSSQESRGAGSSWRGGSGLSAREEGERGQCWAGARWGWAVGSTRRPHAWVGARVQATKGRSGVVGPRWASFGPTVGMFPPFSVFSIFSHRFEFKFALKFKHQF
jgi:hypothetical protein